MKNEGFDKNSFLNTLVQESMRRIKKGPEEIEKFYDGYRKLIDNQLKKTPEREEECKEMLEILEKTYTMFSNPEVEDILTKNDITHKQFLSQYGERILGDNKRKYDMSDRFNPDLIAYQDKEKQVKKVKYAEKEGVERIYINAEGKRISIQEIGRLYFEEWNKLQSYIEKYRIKKQMGKDNYRVYEVFTSIRTIMMDNPEYRDAVLEELLGENNIQLSKAGNYIGKIEDTTIYDRDFTEGSERIVGGDYFYRVSPKYMLAYRSEEQAAATLHSMYSKNTLEAKTEEQKIFRIQDNQRYQRNINSSNDSQTKNEGAGGESR